MDSKNVIAAIALSSAVIVLYSLFFVPEQKPKNQNLVEKEKSINQLAIKTSHVLRDFAPLSFQ